MSRTSTASAQSTPDARSTPDAELHEVHRGMFALDLANAFIAEMEIDDPREVELTQGDVLIAAQHLAETVGPLRWEGFDPADFFRCIDYMQPRDLEGVGLRLMGFYGWMVLRDVVDPGPGLRILAALRDAAPPSNILSDLYRCAELQLHAMLKGIRRRPN
jgi:hypothetical protein